MIENNRRIDLRRRVSAVEISTSTGWYDEIFPVTSEVTSTGIATLAHAPILGSEIVKVNGLVVANDPDWDYAISGSTITFNVGHLLTIGDTIFIKYQAQT